MYLLKTISNLSEQEIEKRKAEDVWAEGSPATYRTSALYAVRQIEDTMPVQFEAFKIVGDKRKPYGKFNAVQLKKVLAPIRPNQKPDAEGFTTYVDPAKVEAFQYTGDTCIVLLDGDSDPVKLVKGDYLVRGTKKDSFVYSVESEADFQGMMTKE